MKEEVKLAEILHMIRAEYGEKTMNSALSFLTPVKKLLTGHMLIFRRQLPQI
jgi:hypothetical protein